MSSSGSATRPCSRQTCRRDAVMTLTYVYSDSTAVVGPLAGHAEPHAYDLCAVHADRLTVPRGWRVVRLELPEDRARREDIGAVAEAVREAEPPAPVRDRPRTVLRDVSLPRSTAPRATPQPAPPQPAPPRRSSPQRSSAERRAAPGASVTSPAAPEDPQVAASENRRPRGPRTSPEAPTSVPGPAPAAPAAGEPRTAAPAAASRPVSRPAPEVAWHDVPMPGTLQRPHLRRPAAGGRTGRPEA
ncbi:DUF3499 family protein [Kocuria sp. CPCC 205268]|uniref:DUF3499 family protein n=1 Tax=Kocuria oxytropis TaxID=3058913 RepID=UPI0034D457F5